MTTEFALELARGLARKALSPATTPQPNLQSSLVQAGGYGYPILGFQQREEDNQDIFGYRPLLVLLLASVLFGLNIKSML